MFTQYFGLKFNPFSKEIDDKHLYASSDFKELVSRLDYMKKTRGLFLLTADAGIGKTTALRHFAGSLNPGLYRVCYSAISSLTVMDFYRGLIMGMGAVPEYGKIKMFDQLQRLVLVSHHEKRVTPVFILDEAQSLSNSILEDLRMIFNFKMDSENPFIMIMAGHHTVRHRLQLSCHQALRQRFVGNYHMKGLSKDETKEYLSSRLKAAGAADAGIFLESAAESIAGQSNGSPRVINNIADAALKLAALKDKRAIDGDLVYEAARDTEI
jgi:type II secretory pathway predicted ATPase ExeA